MFNVSKLLRVLSLCPSCPAFRKHSTFRCISNCNYRTYADTTKVKAGSKQDTGPEDESRMRVRRARPSDVPRVLRFVREHARLTWPCLDGNPTTPNLILGDYLSRALAQGHSMLAEQQEIRRGWTQIRGVALGTAVCPWDACMIDKWSRCMRCLKSKRMMQFQAHCLRAPSLHDKYRVHSILQIMMIIPGEEVKSEIVKKLANNAINRGKEVGFKLIRFDVTSRKMAKILEEIHLKKEWQDTYDILPDSKMLKEQETSTKSTYEIRELHKRKENNKGFIAVFTADTKLKPKVLTKKQV